MFFKPLNIALFGNKIQSIQIHFSLENKQYHFIEIERKKNDLTIINKFTSESFEDLTAKLSKNKPIILTLTGQGVLSKKVKNDVGYQSKILFNADSEDFYWYEYRQNDQVYVSVARKEIIDSEIKLFDEAKFTIVDFAMGPFGASSIYPLLETNILQTNETTLYFDNSLLSEFEKRNETNVIEYHLGTEKLTDNDILGFANSFNNLYPNKAIVSEKATMSSRKEEFTYKKAFNVLGIFTLSFFLISLLISYLMLGNYQTAHHKMQVELGEQNVAYSKLISLEKDKENKEAILKQSGLNDSNFLSFYIAEITEDIPTEINLKTLSIFPTTSKIKSEQRIDFNNNVIEIEGTALSNTAFTSWIKELKKHNWVGNLEIIDFQRENRTNSFVIKLILKFDV